MTLLTGDLGAPKPLPTASEFVIASLKQKVRELEETNIALRSALKDERESKRRILRTSLEMRQKLDYIEQTKPR